MVKINFFMLILVFCVLTVLSPLHVSSRFVFSASSARKYLSKYGWLDSSKIKPPDAASFSRIREAVKGFQEFAGLPKTGELDQETIELMTTPRCGVRDTQLMNSSDSGRRKRFVLQGSRWKIRNLTYSIQSYPDDLDEEIVDNEIERAFNIWTNETNISFQKYNGSGKIHIRILFDSGDHGDSEIFDGPGGTFAHAFFPTFGGGAHFDLDEPWSSDSYDGINLFQVAAHEFGHSLGLGHSKRKKSIMSPFYYGFQPHFKLHDDDIFAIQTLYGRRLEGSRKLKTKPKDQSTGREQSSKPSSANIELKREEDPIISSLNNNTQQEQLLSAYFLIPPPLPVSWSLDPNTYYIPFFI